MMSDLISFVLSGPSPSRASYAKARYAVLGADIELESRTVLSTTNVSVTGGLFTLNGVPTRLLFYGTYGALDRTFDYAKFFDTVKSQYNVNAVRVWVNFHWDNDLAPYSKSGGTSNPVYNLRSFDPTFFDRLKAFVKAADQRGIVVQATLFDGVMLETANANRWNWSPYNDARNDSHTNYLSTASRFDKFFNVDADNPVWRDVNKPLIQKVVQTLGDFGNVIYEVMNEPTVIDEYSGTDAQKQIRTFHERVVNELKDNLAARSGSKVVSVNPGASGILFDWAAGSSRVDMLAVHINSVAQASSLNGNSKPIIISNDGDASCATPAQNASYGKQTRAQRTADLLLTTFQGEAANRFGSRHFEFLDLGLYGKTWGSGSSKTPPNYDAQASLIDKEVLRQLASYGRRNAGAQFVVDETLAATDVAKMNKFTFYPQYYLSLYADLRAAFGAQNYAAATQHWLTYGIREGRQPNPFFSARAYLNRYADLRAAFGNDLVRATEHWLRSGIDEGRIGV